MAWNTPLTWDTGRLVTAADLNAQIRDNFQYLKQRAAVTVGYTSKNTTSTTYVQLFSWQNIVTTAGARVLVCASGFAQALGQATSFSVTLAQDGATPSPSDPGLAQAHLQSPLGWSAPWAFSVLTSVLTPAMHTFTVYFRTNTPGSEVSLVMTRFLMLEV
ncbi:MAG: hypothetical protein GX484_05370 [Chloroflexi bacterium]|nr:hypothetical protein [Chloroflexota bacterium]